MQGIETLAQFADAGAAVLISVGVLTYGYRYHCRVRDQLMDRYLAANEKHEADLEELQEKHRAERSEWRTERAQIAQDRMTERRECDDRYERTNTYLRDFLAIVEALKKKGGA